VPDLRGTGETSAVLCTLHADEMVFPVMEVPGTHPTAGPVSGQGERSPEGVLRDVFGFDSFRGQQLAIVEHVVAGGDAVVLMRPEAASRYVIRSPRCCVRASGSWYPL